MGLGILMEESLIWVGKHLVEKFLELVDNANIEGIGGDR